MMITKCIPCGTTWSGKRPQHCPACHLTFGGTTAGDRHRVGPFGPERRCLTEAECEEAGLVPRLDSETGTTIWGGKSPVSTAWGRDD